MQISSVDTQTVVEGVKRRFTWRWLSLGMAVMLWMLAIVRLDITALGDFGLLNALSITYYLALVLVVVSFLAELFSKKPSSVVLGFHLVALTIFIHATVALTFPEPRYSWSFKHFGVTEHIDLYGMVSPRSDIYQNWPGFFALTSWFGQVAGIKGPIDYAPWSQLFFNLVYLLELALVFRMLSKNLRVVWLALLIFLCSSWVGQDYFAPQAFVFALVIAVYGLFLRWLVVPDPTDGLSKFVRRFIPVRDATPDDVPTLNSNAGQRYWAVLGAGFLFFVLTFSHQLTPYMMIAALALLTLFGCIVSRTVLFLFAAIAFFYLLPHLTFVVDKYGLLSGFDPLANAQNTNIEDGGAESRKMVANFARGLSGFIFLLAIVGFGRRLLQGRREIVAGILMVSPFVIVLGQSYGGEAIYRVYLFALPWAAYLGAQAILPVGRKFRALKMLQLLPVFAMLAMLLPAYFGLEKVNEMKPSDVQVSHYFYDNAPAGSALLTLEPNFLTNSRGNYASFLPQDDKALGAALVNEPELDVRNIATPELVVKVREYIEGMGGERKFLILGPSQSAYSEAYGKLPADAVENLNAALSKSADWTVFYRNGDSVIFELARR